MQDSKELLESIFGLTEALVQHARYLQQHDATMASLIGAIKDLETSINQSCEMETDLSPQPLKQAITSFVETYINPRFYQSHKLLNAD